MVRERLVKGDEEGAHPCMRTQRWSAVAWPSSTILSSDSIVGIVVGTVTRANEEERRNFQWWLQRRTLRDKIIRYRQHDIGHPIYYLTTLASHRRRRRTVPDVSPILVSVRSISGQGGSGEYNNWPSGYGKNFQQTYLKVLNDRKTSVEVE